MSKYKRIIGSRAVLNVAQTDPSGNEISVGEGVTIIKSYKGYTIESDSGVVIENVPKHYVRIFRGFLRKQ